MNKKQYALTIIIPARNEEKTINKTLDNLLKKVEIPTEYIIINDQSTDQTTEKVKKYLEKHANVFLFETKANKVGFANALVLGFKKARTPYVLPVMADLCDDPKTIDIMYKKISEGYEIVAGSRYISGGGKSGGPKLQAFFSHVVCSSLHYLTGIPTTDVSNSFKMYKKSLLKRLIVPKSFGVETSMFITLQAYFKGAKIAEVPTFWRGRKEGKSKFNILKRFPRYLYIYAWAIHERIKQLSQERFHKKTVINLYKP